MMRTSRVSPGAAPSTQIGPVRMWGPNWLAAGFDDPQVPGAHAGLAGRQVGAPARDAVQRHPVARAHPEHGLETGVPIPPVHGFGRHLQVVMVGHGVPTPARRRQCSRRRLRRAARCRRRAPRPRLAGTRARGRPGGRRRLPRTAWASRSRTATIWLARGLTGSPPGAPGPCRTARSVYRTSWGCLPGWWRRYPSWRWSAGRPCQAPRRVRWGRCAWRGRRK